MTANYRTTESTASDLRADPEQDAVYSNAERQREQLEAKGYSDEEIDEILDGDDEDEGDSGNVRKARDEYERVDDALFEAYEKSVWWGLGAEENGLELALEKAPGIWDDGDQVPEFVRELIADVIESTDWDWDEFESVSNEQEERLEEIVEDVLTQPDGWTVGELTERFEDEFDWDEGQSLGVARDTAHNTISTSREEAYDRMEGSEGFEFSWIGPDDNDTTPTCQEIKAEIEDRDGSVPKDDLKEILRQKAEKYENTREGGGTPERVEYWEPHFQCRHVMVREVQ